jgi:hypothetical protein
MDKFDTERDMDVGRGERSNGLGRGIILKSILRNRLWSGCMFPRIKPIGGIS